MALRDERDKTLERRWLQSGQIGEEYAPCYSCPTATRNATCRRTTTYEFSDTVISQCFSYEYIDYPNGTLSTFRWMVRKHFGYASVAAELTNQS